MSAISYSRAAGRSFATTRAQRSSFLKEDDVGMELLALGAALFVSFYIRRITAPSKLRMSFSTGFGNTKSSTLGVVPMRSVTNLGKYDHQGKKVFLVRVRSPSGPFRTTEYRLRSHPAPGSDPSAKQKFRLTQYPPFRTTCPIHPRGLYSSTRHGVLPETAAEIKPVEPESG